MEHDDKSRDAPIISVAMITYNHGAFVDQALASILEQDTNIPYEIVIGDDCSRDDTTDRLRAWTRQYPGQINLLLRERNVGMMENFLEVLEACKGKYIAFLEGDDYWTDKGKLSSQIEILERNRNLSLVFGQVEVYDQELERVVGLKQKVNQERRFSLSEVLLRNPANLMTAFFRNPYWSVRPAVFDRVPFGDWPLFVHLAESGDLAYFPKTWARYRIHGGGVWQGGKAGNMREREVQMLQRFQELFPPFHRKIGNRIRQLQLAICEDYRKLKDYRTSIAQLRKAMKEAGVYAVMYVPGSVRLVCRMGLERSFYIAIIQSIGLKW